MNKFLKPVLVKGNWFVREDFTKEELIILGEYYGVYHKNITLTAKAHTHLSYEDGVLIGDDIIGISGKGMEVVRDDMFEPITQELPQPSETSVTPTKYNYTKCEFKHVGEALTAFCEGVALYYIDARTKEYTLVEDEIACLKKNNLYTKQETPWYERISAETPVYCLSPSNQLTKYTGRITKMASEVYKPLTDEMVNDIVQTMKNFNGGAE